MVFGNVVGAFHQFGFEASPETFAVLSVLSLEQPESLFGGKLSNSGEILYAKPI